MIDEATSERFPSFAARQITRQSVQIDRRDRGREDLLPAIAR
jgi:hypothetical protein